jgi:3-hydroxyisobutyrate dehydrogenase-like beta-hydroxyacid dehydrogenase
MRIGFIGTGAMGEPMARNLCRAGFAVTVYNRTRSRAEPLTADGARLAESPTDAVRDADVVITILADDAATEQVTLVDGLLAALSPDAVHVCMATISPALSERLTEAHTAAGRAFVAAPVFGRPNAAADAKLSIVAAGDSAVFAALGQRTFVVGERPAAANVVKLSGNFLLASMIESLGEAFALVRKSGVDPALYLDIITSTLFAAPAYKNYGSIIAEERFSPPGFRLPLGLKDVRLVLQTAEAVNVPMPVASLVRDQLLSAMARGYEDLDWAVLARVAAENAGLE